MRRPIKYKAANALRNRIILIATTSVLGVGIIGGTVAAVASSRANQPTPTPEDSTPEIISTDAITTEPLDTVVPTDAVTTPEITETDPVTETEPATETEPVITETEPVATEPVTEEITEETTEEPTPPDVELSEVGTMKNYYGGTLDLADYPTLAELEAAAKALHNQGYTAVMVELKYDNGKLAYLSDVPAATTYGANPSVAAHKLRDIVNVLHKEGLYVTARVCVFRDDLAAKSNSAAALMNTSGFRYSDGASRWLSVYTNAAQEYIVYLIDEMQKAGVDEVMLRDFGLPANTGTKAPLYREDTTKEDAVTAFITRLDKIFSALTINLELDAATIANGGDAERGIDVEALSKLADSITVDLTLANLGKSLTVGDTTIADVYADPKATVELLLSSIDASALPIRPLLELTDYKETDKAIVELCKDRGYNAYQTIGKSPRMNEK